MTVEEAIIKYVEKHIGSRVHFGIATQEDKWALQVNEWYRNSDGMVERRRDKSLKRYRLSEMHWRWFMQTLPKLKDTNFHFVLTVDGPILSLHEGMFLFLEYPNYEAFSNAFNELMQEANKIA